MRGGINEVKKGYVAMEMTQQHQKDPLHGITLEAILTKLVEKYGWEKLGKIIEIKCFTHEPSIKSSLKFLRNTPWARELVEKLYLKSLPQSKKG
jgi:uncharacterized protein (DUF2132 family)